MAIWFIWCESEFSCKIAVAKKDILAAALGISTFFAKAKGFPLSTLSASASSSNLSVISDAILCNTSLRFFIEVFDQEEKALEAAFSAKATSFKSESGIYP